MAERNEPIISFRDFSFQYRAQKRPTLTGIDLDIYPGVLFHGLYFLTRQTKIENSRE